MAGRTLSIGDTGDDVKNWQHYLASQGFPVDADGYFGPQTLAATRTMQRRMGLKPDGKVGHRTVDKSETPLPRLRPVSAPQPFAPGPAFQSSGPEADLNAMHSAASNNAADAAMAQELMGQNYDARAADAASQRDAPPYQPAFADTATGSPMPGMPGAVRRAQGLDPVNFPAEFGAPVPQIDVGGAGGPAVGGQPGLSAGAPAGGQIDPVKRDALIRALLMQAGG